MSQPFLVVKNGNKSAETSLYSFKMAELPTSSLHLLRMRLSLPLTRAKDDGISLRRGAAILYGGQKNELKNQLFLLSFRYFDATLSIQMAT